MCLVKWLETHGSTCAVRGAHHDTSIWEGHQLMGRPPAYGKATSLWEGHQLMGRPPAYGKATSLWEGHQLMGRPPAYGKATSLWEGHQLMGRPPAYGKATSLWEGHQLMGRPPAYGKATSVMQDKSGNLRGTCRCSCSKMVDMILTCQAAKVVLWKRMMASHDILWP